MIDFGGADNALLDRVQRQSLAYFWSFGHPVSGMARDRSSGDDDTGSDVVTTGGTGMGVMAIIAGTERGWITRADAVARILKLVRFLYDADHFHGVFPHFMNGATGRAVRFSRKDDGGDLVETAFLMQGLLAARQYFDGPGDEAAIRGFSDALWRDVEWSWHARDGRKVLTWHWSPNHGFVLDHEIRGWNECLMVYLLAASSPSFPIDPSLYLEGFAQARDFRNGRSYHGIELPLGPPFGGPLFFAHYSFLGLDPRGLSDRYADYWEQNSAHVAINRAHCVANPHRYAGYGADCWGLTASDGEHGYSAHAPDQDNGVISPTAALSSLPYAPDWSLAAMRQFVEIRGDALWRRFGPVDGFSPATGWAAKTHLAIDQGPIVVMIENARSALLWNLFMSCPEILMGLKRLSFSSPWLAK